LTKSSFSSVLGEKRGEHIMVETMPLNPQQDPTVFDTLLEPVQAYVEQQNQQRTLHHNETYSYGEFFRLLVFYFVSDIPSIALLIKTYLKKNLVSPALKLRYVPRSTFNDAFERFSPDLFRDVFVFLLSTISLHVVPELAALGVFYCMDGSLFPALCSMRWAEYRSTCQALKLHLCFELNRMIAVDFLVGTGKSSERDALRQMLAAGVTYIADRGYVCFRLFHDVLEAEAHLIFRMRANLQYEMQTLLTVQVPSAVRLVFRDITDQLISCSNDPYGHRYRLVTFWAGPIQFLLLTDRDDLTTFQVMLLYAYRWQVELIFRFLKRTMNGIHLIHHSQDGVTIQFSMLLIVSLLQLRLKQQAMSHHNQQEASESQEPNQSQEPEQRQESTKSSPETVIPVFHHLPSDQDLSHPYRFFEMIGKKLATYWKLGIHWLSTLRRILHYPFNDHALELLDSG
jgi:hypothetical protein